MKPPAPGEPRALRVYTDIPTRHFQTFGGHLDFETSCNVIVHRMERKLTLENAETRLSLRCAFGGVRRYQSQEGHFAVSDAGYLLLNLGQRVSSHLSEPTPIEIFNVTFRPEFAEEVLRSLATPADHLLDAPQGGSSQPVQFFERVYPHDEIVSPVLFDLREQLMQRPVTHGWLEERFHLLLERLLQAHRAVRREIEAMPALRQATRTELYQRLHRARDYMDAESDKPLTLERIAEEACFSPHHFLRVFKQVFKVTPHQYLTNVRLHRACTLLSRTELPVSQICLEVGFESVGSFSWLFSRRFGMSPTAYRLQRANAPLVSPH